MSQPTDNEWLNMQRELRELYGWDHIEVLQYFARKLKQSTPDFNFDDEAGLVEWNECQKTGVNDAEVFNDCHSTLKREHLTQIN